MNDAQATREFLIRNILTGHCGEHLTPDRVDQIVSEIATAMASEYAWAFCRGDMASPRGPAQC